MNSIRTKTTLLTVCAIVIALAIATLLGVSAIRNVGSKSSDQLLLLLCESGEKNLNSYFEGVEHSVSMVTAYVEEDLKGMDTVSDEELGNHLKRVRDIFAKITYNTNGVLTYYYRIDPQVSTKEKGFWYVNLDGSGFEEHEPTDITQYDTNDTSVLVWFTVPKATGKPIWQPPYITDNLDVRVLSYNMPIYKGRKFIGVVGIEIDYSTMAEQVDNIKLYDHGYAFINDAEGNLIYHPNMDVASMETQPKVPQGLLSDESHIRYTYDGVEKQAVWLPLENGMRLNVSVPVSEINADWHRWINEIVIVTILLLAVFIVLTMRLTGRITKPLGELTQVAERVNEGEYDLRLDYRGKDEVGILTQAFNKLTENLETYINSLNDLAYADALTGVHNKGAFDIYVQRMEEELQEADMDMEFAICIFDCNNLKSVNDQYGHDKGNIYLKMTCALICEVFDHSPVFRLGGDEFAAILQNQDYINREELLAKFDQACDQSRVDAEHVWERIDVARGIAIYDKGYDYNVNEVARRADKLMYENKWETKRRS